MILFLFLFSISSFAGSISSFFTPSEYEKNLLEISHKVNLFADSWAQNPNMKYTGGTVRDYVFWFNRQFRNCENKACAEKVLSDLRRREIIDLREFILEESDVDIVGDMPANITAKDYGVLKFDSISSETFDASSKVHQSAVDQGFIPLERMLLSKNEITTGEGFGNALHDIYAGNISISFADAEKFWKTDYAAKRLNHPILLVERYLRSVSLYYNALHDSKAHPDLDVILAPIDQKTKKILAETVKSTLSDPKFYECLKQSQFVHFFNKAALKAFRAYTNPTATHRLFTYFHFEEVLPRVSGAPKINQFLFTQSRTANDLEVFRKRLEEYGVMERDVLENVSKRIPNHTLYHGTKSREAVEDIILRGIYESVEQDKSAGRGVYSVTETSKKFAENWSRNATHVVRFEISDDARIVDYRNSNTHELYEKFQAKEGTDGGYTKFCEYFGFDAVFYPYNEVDAVVIKNSSIIEKNYSEWIQVKPIANAIADLLASRDAEEIALNLKGLIANKKRLTSKEKDVISKFLLSDKNRSWIASEVDLPQVREALIHLCPVSMGIKTILENSKAITADKRTDFILDVIAEKYGLLKSEIQEALQKAHVDGSLEKSIKAIDVIEQFFNESDYYEVYSAVLAGGFKGWYRNEKFVAEVFKYVQNPTQATLEKILKSYFKLYGKKLDEDLKKLAKSERTISEKDVQFVLNKYMSKYEAIATRLELIADHSVGEYQKATAKWVRNYSKLRTGVNKLSYALGAAVSGKAISYSFLITTVTTSILGLPLLGVATAYEWSKPLLLGSLGGLFSALPAWAMVKATLNGFETYKGIRANKEMILKTLQKSQAENLDKVKNLSQKLSDELKPIEGECGALIKK